MSRCSFIHSPCNSADVAAPGDAIKTSSVQCDRKTDGALVIHNSSSPAVSLFLIISFELADRFTQDKFLAESILSFCQLLKTG